MNNVPSIFACCFALATFASAQEQPTVDVRGEWSDYLKAFFRFHQVPMLVDLPEAPYGERPPALRPDYELGELSVPAFTATIGRQRLSIDERLVFVRYPGDRFGRPRLADSLSSLVWSLSPDQLKGITGEGISFSSLSSEQQEFVLRAVGDDFGLAYPVALAGEQARIRLEANTLIRSVKPDGTIRAQSLYDFKPFPKDESEFPLENQKPQARPESRQPHKFGGELDFGIGRVIELDELAREAGMVFGKRWEFDGRLAKSPAFVCGAWTEAAFDKSFAALLETLEARPVKRRADKQTLDALLQAPGLEALMVATRDEQGSPWPADSEFKAGDRVSRQALARLRQAGISPTDRVVARPALFLVVEAPGMRRLPGFILNSSGEKVFTWTPNAKRIGLQ